jgi:hypothetical protein
MIGSDIRYCFSSWNASSSFSVQTKGLDFHSSLKNGRARSASLEIKWLSTANHPMSQPSHELLDILDAGWWPHYFDCLDLLRVGLDSLVQNQEAE